MNLSFLNEFTKWLWGKVKMLTLIVFPFLGLLAYFLEGLGTITDGLNALHARLVEFESVMTPQLPQIASIWNMARWFFPVDYGLWVAGLILGVFVIATGVRLIKALIPLWN
jgi:hypothetical protein